MKEGTEGREWESAPGEAFRARAQRLHSALRTSTEGQGLSLAAALRQGHLLCCSVSLCAGVLLPGRVHQCSVTYSLWLWPCDCGPVTEPM